MFVSKPTKENRQIVEVKCTLCDWKIASPEAKIRKLLCKMHKQQHELLTKLANGVASLFAA